MHNLGTVEQYRKSNSSYPGCWAYPDMLEVGVSGHLLNDGVFPRSALTAEESALHMSMVKGPTEALPELNGHCVDGAATRVTITSSTAADGQRVWQLGGELSETGCERDPEAQTEAARSCLRAVLPGFDVDTPRLSWSSYRIDRAEHRESHTTVTKRPDDVTVIRTREAIAVWPTKLVLAPRAAAMVSRLVGGGSGPSEPPFRDLPTPPIAEPPWEGAEWN